MEVTVQFTGMRELIQRLKHMPDTIKADADEVIADVAEGMRRAVSNQYRRGPTGKLKRGVRVRKMGQMEYRVRSGAPHAHLVEFGTQPRKTKKGAGRGSMPRFGPIFGVEKMRWKPVMMRRLEHVLAKAGRGAGSPSSGLL